MGWLIEQIFDEIFGAIARGIYRTSGWVGCIVIFLGIVAVIALVVWLLIMLANSQ